MKPHRATLILVLGILGLVTCQFLGIFAWIMGGNDLKEMDQGLMDPSGRSNTQVGRILGIISTVLLAIGLGFMVIWVLFVGTLIAAG